MGCSELPVAPDVFSGSSGQLCDLTSPMDWFLLYFVQYKPHGKRTLISTNPACNELFGQQGMRITKLPYNEASPRTNPSYSEPSGMMNLPYYEPSRVRNFQYNGTSRVTKLRHHSIRINTSERFSRTFEIGDSYCGFQERYLEKCDVGHN
jgi:hypothetical protein